ncbi:hypothetical protein Q5752_000951 [Cryptotrichosporon argae]
MALLLISAVKATRHALVDMHSDNPRPHLKHGRPRRGLVYTPIYDGLMSLDARRKKGKARAVDDKTAPTDHELNDDDVYADREIDDDGEPELSLSPLERDTKHSLSPIERDVKAHPIPFDDPPPYPGLPVNPSAPTSSTPRPTAYVGETDQLPIPAVSPFSSAATHRVYRDDPRTGTGTCARGIFLSRN